jgi:hypothetical protein
MPHPGALSPLFKLYAWSIILDPMLFFILLEPNFSGITVTLARLVQGLFVTLFICHQLSSSRLWCVPNPLSPFFINFTLYVSLLLGASFVGGLILETYTLNQAYNDTYNSLLVEIIRSPYFRPLIEFLILVAYFLYYIVLPRHMIRSKAEFEYLFNWIIRVLYLMLTIGLLEVVISYFGWGYIPKHSIHIEYGYVGDRFHALLGEPRDAFAYLMFALAIAYVRNTLLPELKTPRLLVLAVIFALLLTQSASGLLGLCFAAAGLLAYLSFVSMRYFFTCAFAVIVSAVVISYLSSFSPRLEDYIEVYSGIWGILNSGETLPYLLAVQSSNFLPLYSMWLSIKEINLFPVLFGSGLGSVNIVNNNLAALYIEDSFSALMNSNAQITRILFESGAIGFLVYLAVFISPFKRFLVNYKRNTRINVILFALTLGASLSHRSSSIFIYLGIIIAVLSNWPSTNNSEHGVSGKRNAL